MGFQILYSVTFRSSLSLYVEINFIHHPVVFDFILRFYLFARLQLSEFIFPYRLFFSKFFVLSFQGIHLI